MHGMAAGRNHTSPVTIAAGGGSSTGGKSRISSSASFVGGGDKPASGSGIGGGGGGGRERDHGGVGGGGGRDHEAFDRDRDRDRDRERERSRSEGHSSRDLARERDRDRSNVNSNVTHHTVRDSGRDVIGRDSGRDAGRDLSRDAVRDVGRDAGRDAGKDFARDAGRDGGRDGGRDVGRDAGRDDGRDGGRSAGRDAGRDGGRDGFRDVGREGGRDDGRDAGRDAARDAPRDVGRDGARDTGRESGRDAGGRDVGRDYRTRNLPRDDISARDSLSRESREGTGGGGYGKEKDRSDRSRDWEQSSDRGRGGEKVDRERDIRERDKKERDLSSSRERDLNSSRERDLNGSRERDLNSSRERDLNSSRERDLNSSRGRDFSSSSRERERDLNSSRHLQQRRHVGGEAAAEGGGGERASSPLPFGRTTSVGAVGGSVSSSIVRNSVSPASDGLIDKETNALGEMRSSGSGRLPSGKEVEMEPGELPSLGARVEEISWRPDVSVSMTSSSHSRNARNSSTNNNMNKPSSLAETTAGGGGNRSSSPPKKRKYSPIVWDYDEKQARSSSNKLSNSATGASSSVSLAVSKFGLGSSQSSQLPPVQSSATVQVLSSPATSNENFSSPPSKPPSSGRVTPRGSSGGHRMQSLSISPQEITPQPFDRSRGSPLIGEFHNEKHSPDVQMQDQVMASSMSDDEPEPGQLFPEPDDSPSFWISPDRVEEDTEVNATSPIITIAASRWAGETNTPERGRSPRGGGGKARKRSSSSESEEGLISSGQEGGHGTSGRSTSPQPGEFIQEKADAAAKAKERGTDSDGSVGRGSDGKGRRSRSIEDEEYERELNKRELMELDEEDFDNDDEEEQRPEVDPEYDDVPPTPPQPLSRAIDMLQGCRSVDEFERLNRIDEGTYGVVYRARNRKTGEIVALKKVKMDKEKDGFPQTSLREINVLLSFHHPSVVDVKEVVVGSTIDSIFMVMEYMEHDLKGLMETMKQPFSQSEVKCLMLQLFEGVKYLHDNWVLHRDLKTSNLLMNNRGELKICDFGMARQYGSPLKAYSNMVVTLWYRAPELLLGPKNYQYSTAIDMWSLGCIMAEFLAKEPLFNGNSEIDQIDKIFKTLGTPNEKIWPEFPKLPGVKCNFVRQPYNKLRERFPPTAFAGRPTLSESGFDLLNRLLTYDPQKRIAADEALKHEWFREVPLPKSKEFMPTFPARSEHDRRVRRLMKSPDPLEEQRKRELRQGELGGGGLFG